MTWSTYCIINTEQTKKNIFLPTNWWRCHEKSSIFNHSKHLYAGLWKHCLTTLSNDGRSISRNVAHLNILAHDVIKFLYYESWIRKHKYFYQQTDGVALGDAASSTTTEIYMKAYERCAITTLPNEGRSMSRSVAPLFILAQYVINLLYYKYWTDKKKCFYQQTDTVAMGGRASSTRAEIYIQAGERTAITTLLDDGRSISRNVAHLNTLVHDLINLLYCE